MKNLELKDWYVKDNKLLVSLMEYFVEINPRNDGKRPYYELAICGSDYKLVFFKFDTLEEAIYFVENVARYCPLEKMKELEKKMHKKAIAKINKGNSKVFLTPTEVDEAIIDYFGKNKEYRVSTKEELTYYDGQASLVFYIIEHITYNGARKDLKTRLTKGDLKNALNAYLEMHNLEVVDFSCARADYNVDESVLSYEGLELTVRDKDKKLTRKK